MANTTTLHVRIDSNLKQSAEEIFEQLGITSAEAIKLFYKQVELNGGIPFDVKIPSAILTEKRLLSELESGENSAKKDGWLSIEESKKKLGL
ncbi:MAG: type II toxin-antitoxin system RelB/DinJ family antitoxin [Clostridia bacterium]|nr:type II toxin-antitoxin system RelB/DinJ family antitoxin [Clostridia bacterium]